MSRLPREDTGATATEYALLVTFIALAIVLGTMAFGTVLNTTFNDFGDWVVATL